MAHRGHIRNAARSISECVASVEERQVDDDDMDDDDDDDMELLSAECDDFTTLSQLNEQQQSLSAALQLPATTTTATDDKLIDVDADADADVGGCLNRSISHLCRICLLAAMTNPSI